MKTGKYTLSDFYSHRNFEQIIIPEIQRDYVWGKEQIEPFLIDLNNGIIDFNTEEEKLKNNIEDLENITIQEQFLEYKLKQNFSYNIGFIYAYQDDEYPGYMFLIDGQQRFTTLFLLALALAIKEDRKDDFKKTFVHKNNKNRLDYRVRNSASEFLAHYTEYVLEHDLEGINNISKQYWYFSDFDQDATIQNILQAFRTIIEFINEEDSVLNYHYINHYVDFWYFDTNISEQGEELYIYMNARGEAVQENENIKANLLSKLPNEALKNEYGTKWEDWQNFFWENRGINKNADIGFDEFLRWILIIKAAEKNKSDDINYNKLLEGKLVLKNVEQIITLPEIELYFKALQYLFKKFAALANDIEIQYEAKFHKFKMMILSEWLTRDNNSRSHDILKKENNKEFHFLRQINLFRLLPIVQYIYHHIKNENEISIDNDNLYRIIRYFYNISRTDNLSKATRESIINAIGLINKLVANDDNDITAIIHFDISKTILTSEESNKLQCYKLETDNSKRRRIESAFWYCEDFELSDATINFVLSCVLEDTALVKTGINAGQLDMFNKYNQQFQSIFKNRNDKLRKAILTFGDYSLHEGENPTLGGYRYSLGNIKEQWLKILNLEPQKFPIQNLLEHFQSNNIQPEDIDKTLQELINHYNVTVEDGSKEYSWMYEFIKHPKNLEYCQKKNFCWLNENTIYLLYSEKAMDGSFKRLRKTKLRTS